MYLNHVPKLHGWGRCTYSHTFASNHRETIKNRVATVREKSGKNRLIFFFKVRRKSGNCASSQGILRLAGHLVLERDSLVVKVILLKNSCKDVDFCWLYCPRICLGWSVAINWSLVSEKSGRCQGIKFYPNGWQPCRMFLLNSVRQGGNSFFSLLFVHLPCPLLPAVADGTVIIIIIQNINSSFTSCYL